MLLEYPNIGPDSLAQQFDSSVPKMMDDMKASKIQPVKRAVKLQRTEALNCAQEIYEQIGAVLTGTQKAEDTADGDTNIDGLKGALATTDSKVDSILKEMSCLVEIMAVGIDRAEEMAGSTYDRVSDMATRLESLYRRTPKVSIDLVSLHLLTDD